MGLPHPHKSELCPSEVLPTWPPAQERSPQGHHFKQRLGGLWPSVSQWTGQPSRPPSGAAGQQPAPTRPSSLETQPPRNRC